MIVVFDNNVILSAIFNTTSVPYKAFEKALLFHTIIRSDNIFNELTRVMYKPKFDKYIPPSLKEEFLHYYLGRTIKQHINHTVELCRDPNDNMYLELALSGKAESIISGDKDLLVLNPFQGISIITPQEFLSKY